MTLDELAAALVGCAGGATVTALFTWVKFNGRVTRLESDVRWMRETLARIERRIGGGPGP